MVKSLTKINKNYIYNFSDCVIKESYEAAYSYLVHTFYAKKDCRGDNVIRIGFILLHEILEYKNILKYIESLQELTLDDRPQLEYWNNFCLNVVNGDYSKAKENLEISAQEQENVSIITRAMICLINKAISIKEDKAKLEEIINNLKKLIDEGKQEEAILDVEEVKESIKDERIREKYVSIIELIKTIIALKKTEKIEINEKDKVEYGIRHPLLLFELYMRDKNYSKALDYIDKVCQIDANNYNNLVKKLLLVLKKYDLNNKFPKKIDKEASLAHFKRFLSVYDINNLDEAMKELTLSLKYSNNNSNGRHNKELLEMLKKLVKMRNDGETLDVLEVNYDLNNAPLYNFNKAISKGDYKKAIAFKNLIKNVDSDIYDIKIEILEEMAKLDKINREIINIGVEEMTQEDEKESFQDATIQENALEESLDYNNLYDYIYNRQYDQALNLVKNKEHKERYEFICALLIKKIYDLGEGIFEKSKETELTGDKYKDFYQALQNCDYMTMRKIIPDLLSPFIKNTKEYELYNLLLEDINELSTKNQRLINMLKMIANKDSFTVDDVFKIMDIIEEKRELEEKFNMPYSYYNALMDLAEMTLYGVSYGFTSADFAQIKVSRSANNKEKFAKALNIGDYITVYQIINIDTWNSEKLEANYSEIFLKLVKKLTNLMFANIHMVDDSKNEDIEEQQPISEEIEREINRLAYELMTPDERKDKHTKEILSQIRHLVKNRRYNEALNRFLESDISYKDSEVIGNLLLIRSIQEANAYELYNKYLLGIEENDPHASRYLQDYIDYIVTNYMEDTKSYKEKNLRI